MIRAAVDVEMSMSPYRTPPPAPRPPSQNDRGDDRVIAAVMAAVGAIPVVIAIVGGYAFGAEATIGLVLLVLGIAGLIRGDRA